MKKAISSVAALLLNAAALAESEAPTAVSAPAKEFPSGIALIIVLVALVIALIVVGGMIAKLKTARRKSDAADYLIRDSFSLDVQHDHFMYETVKRRKIEQQKN